MPEAQLEDLGSGLTPITQGWFVVNVRDAEWWFAETRGGRCAFENEYGDQPVEFPQFGINLTVLEPGQTSLYHAEENQESFLVLSGECALLVEGGERRLRPWDFFHSSPWTEHAFVGVGDGPCVIVMAGSRSGPAVHYPVSELAARYGASVAEETSDWRQAYAKVERFRRERPPDWARLPWAFVPSGFVVPLALTTEQFRLEPLGPKHNDSDYDAWSSSVEHIRMTPGWEASSWPDERSKVDNLRDLRRHADDFESRTGFTYTVLDPATGDVIGCVYIYPDKTQQHDARALSWVRASRPELDMELWRAVTEWLADEWPFERVAYAARVDGA